MAYKFVSTDAAELIAALIESYKEDTGRDVLPASPEMLLLRWVASVILSERALTNYVGDQNVPSRATGENLDALAELTGALVRPAAKPAVGVVRFTLSAAANEAVTVPRGTRVTDPAQSVYFATDEDLTIQAGDLTGDVSVTALEPGEAGNGYAAGTLTLLVDVFPLYGSVTNLTVTAGGSDEYTDEEFRALLRASMAAYSTAGSADSYVYHAKTVSTAIGDVVAMRPVHRETKSYPIFHGHVFLGGEDLLPETLKVQAGELGRDYTVTYVDALLDITVIEGGALDGATNLRVTIDQTGAGDVVIYALMADGSIPDETTKGLILSALSDRTVRPLTDRVTVADPDAVEYDISLTYYRPADSAKTAAQFSADVAAAVEAYKSWQSAALGRDINPQQLIRLLLDAGVKRAVITSPVYTVLKDGSDGFPPEAAVCGTVTITDGGTEDE